MKREKIVQGSGLVRLDTKDVFLPIEAEKGPELSVIVPFRDEGVAPWFMERLEELCASFPKREDIEFIVVDSGSVDEARERCAEICEKYSVSYLYHKSYGQPFHAGVARDFGARYANGRILSFLDVDLRIASDFWDRWLKLISTFGISRYKKAFFNLPCLYLTEEGTEEFRSADPETRFLEFYLRWLYGEQKSIQTMAPCSSSIAIDRLYYLSTGGHRPEFRGHGYEDFELYHRLMVEEETIRRADNYYKDVKTWDTATYNGFRSQLSLLGRPALMSGLFAVHLWHPRPKQLSFYAKLHVNREIWEDIFREFDKSREHPEPLIDSSASANKILIVGQPRTNATRCLRDAIPLLGHPLYMSELDFVDEDKILFGDEFESVLKHHGIGQVIFNAPYGNSARLALYEWCRRTNFPYLVFERGALPESWFFDPNGFNADSKSYCRSKWDRTLSQPERDAAIRYISECVQGGEALEKQGARIGGEALASKLNIGGKKVLFVPMQRPSDSVIKHMAGAAGNCGEFLALIDETAKLLKRQGWVVLCKKHPLETEAPPLKHARYVPSDTHFIDLIELSDSVALINSGVGLYAMMMGKPCFIFGEAFYAIDGVNKRISGSASEVVLNILSDVTVNMELVYKFIYYLIDDFYSFGKSRTLTKQEQDGSLRTQTLGIDFYDLKLPDQSRVRYEAVQRDPIPTWAPLFERYKLDLHQKKQANPKNTPAQAPKPSTSPKHNPTKVVPISHQRSPEDIKAAKWSKLRRNPRAFFQDSKSSIFRPLKYLFSEA